MAAQQADAEGHLWFFTLARTEKVNALRTDKRGCVFFADPDGQRYLSTTGAGELVRSEPKSRELWNHAYKAWFPQGLDDPDMLLIKVLILEVGYWHASEGKTLKHNRFR